MAQKAKTTGKKKKTKVKKKVVKASPKKAATKKAVKKTSTKKTAKKKTVKKAKSAVKKKTVSAKKKKTSRRKAAGNKQAPPSSAIKKTVTKPKRKRIKTYLTDQELAHFRELLIEKLKELLGDVDWIEQISLKTTNHHSSGDLSNMPIHMADIGTDNYEQEFSLGLVDSERKLVREILLAINRIDDKSYGICEGTGQQIPKARLEANLWARYCVEYAQLIEQGKAFENPNGQYWDDEEDIEESGYELDDDGLSAHEGQDAEMDEQDYDIDQEEDEDDYFDIPNDEDDDF